MLLVKIIKTNYLKRSEKLRYTKNTQAWFCARLNFYCTLPGVEDEWFCSIRSAAEVTKLLQRLRANGKQKRIGI